MGKLTYVARKIEGIKTGQVLSKDLKKRIPPGVSARSTARDPTLEIDLSGKEVTDEGFAQFIDDLIECIVYCDNEHPEGAAKVTELHLQGNQLTVQSLAKLAEVVTLSTGSLRELDISRNEIEVVTSKQKKIWQDFLKSFQGCYLLKKLDLGHNPLRACGIEILARVYIQSEVDFLETEAEDVLTVNLKPGGDKVAEDLSNSLKADIKENEEPNLSKTQFVGKSNAVRQKGRGNHPSGGKLSQVDLKHFSCTRGLRSVPYIILSNVPMTSVSAIHISSIVAIHRNPDHLLEFLPAGKTPVLPDTENRCSGLIWSPSEGLGQYGRKLLDMTEVIRQHASVLSDSDEELSERSSSATESTDTSVSKDLQQQQKRDFEYSRVCRRVRVEALKVEGVHSVQLWSTALRMMVISRALLLEDKDRVVNATPEEETQAEQGKTSDSEVPRHEGAPKEVRGTESLPLKNNNISTMVLPGRNPCEWGKVPKSAPMATSHFHLDNQAFHENFPALRANDGDSSTYHSSASRKATANGVTVDKGTPTHQTAKDEAPHSPPRGHTASLPGKTGRTRPPPPVVAVAKKQSWRFGLPFEIWRRIIAEGVGAKGILDREQQTHIMRYASDWHAVAYELGVQGALENEQIWKILDTVNCFTYSPLSGDY